MKIIFLDFDGVLNSRQFRLSNKDLGVQELDRRAVTALNQIVAHSGASVVVSSAWRHAFDLNTLTKILVQHGFKGTVIATTPLFDFSRGIEIKMFLQGIEEQPEAFVILDDDNDMEPFHEHLVRTEKETGLRGHHVGQALKVLGVHGFDEEKLQLEWMKTTSVVENNLVEGDSGRPL